MALQGFPGFRALPRADGERVAAAARLLRVAAGTRLFAAGEPSDLVWGVSEGLVQIVRGGPAGRRLVLEIVPPGELFGAVVALDERPYPAAAVAVEPSVVWHDPSLLVRELARKYPTLRAAILAHAAERLRAAHERLHSLALEPVEQRLARALLMLAERVGTPGDGGTTVTITRQGLADMVGTTVESAIRATRHWQRAGIVRGARNRLTLAEPKGLEAIAAGRKSART